MAFKQQNLSNMSVPTRAGVTPCVYSYFNEDGDNLATLTGAGYLVNMRLAVKDQVHVISADGTKTSIFHVTAVNAGSATMAKSGDITA